MICSLFTGGGAEAPRDESPHPISGPAQSVNLCLLPAWLVPALGGPGTCHQKGRPAGVFSHLFHLEHVSVVKCHSCPFAEFAKVLTPLRPLVCFLLL